MVVEEVSFAAVHHFVLVTVAVIVEDVEEVLTTITATATITTTKNIVDTAHERANQKNTYTITKTSVGTNTHI